MKNVIWKKLSRKCAAVSLLLFLLCAGRIEHVEAAEEKRVLFISSYDDGYELVPEEIKGIMNGFADQNIVLDTEFMDMKRFDTFQNKEIFHQMLTYKLSRLPVYDAIIVGDDAALQFAVQYQKELFAGIPIVFIGINDLSVAQEAADLPLITGIRQNAFLDENIALALKLNPEATKVTALVDETLSGRGDMEQFFEFEDEFPMLDFQVIDVSRYTFDEVGEQIAKIENDNILLYLSMYTDKTGEYREINEVVQFLVERSHVPIYRATAGGLGYGILGGKRVSFDETGELAAKMVLDILSGKPTDSIEMEKTSPSHYYFDYNVMEKYGISEADVPLGSIFINKELTFYEKYKRLVWNVIIVFVVLIILTVLIIIDNVRVRIADKKLSESHQELTDIYKKLLVTEDNLRKQYETIQVYANDIALLNQKYEIAIRGTDSAVWEMQMDTKEIFISSSLNGILKQDFKRRENITNLLKRILSEEIRELLLNEYDSFIKEDKNEIDIQLSVQTGDGVKWVLVRGQGVKDTSGKMTLLYGIILDITRMKEQELHIQNMANNDYLTGIPNRMYFETRLGEELKKKAPCVVVLLDIDNFKVINDTMGHTYGDQILIEVARRLAMLVDKHFFISRIGGDEFLGLISDIEDEKMVTYYIQLIREVFDRPFLLDCKEKIISISMGITSFPEDGKDVNQLIMNADTAMYKVKYGGKNSIIYYAREMKEELKTRADIQIILQEALKTDGFRLLYQPQVNVITGEIAGFEALLRLKKYNISPAEFIEVAEETDLISDIGRYVTKTVVQKIASWVSEGKILKKVAVNFSSKQIRDLTYVEFLRNLLVEYQVPAKYIEIEITESMFLERSERTLEILNEFRELGVSIALDDFGTGFSSLSYLTYIPVDKIKLDKSLSDKFLKLDNISVINSIILLAHSLELEITAEGIEEISQYQKLKTGGCDYIQGYLFSKPLSEEDVELIFDKNFLYIVKPS